MKRRNLLIDSVSKAVTMAFLAIVASIVCPPVEAQVEAQVEALKERAIAQFKAQNYSGAIESLQQALVKAPDDADVHYYLGYFMHYLCYDSVPLTGFGREKSDEVLGHLQKAVEIDPHYGNAYYFIGAEYGARARDDMQLGRTERVAEEFRLGYQAGGYPDWLVEFGRNTLRSCDRDAILFVGGDADTNPVQYLQYVEGYRTDVTVIPVGLLDRPWFVALLKQGRAGGVKSAPISWSEQQIESMHAYKWKTNTVRIPIPESVKQERGIEADAVEWELAPNLGRGETLELLSPGRAVFADIILTNRWERPIYFSLGCSPSLWQGLEKHVQLRGFAQQLLPFEPPCQIDAEGTKALLFEKTNFQWLPTLRDSDMPRASGVLQNYRTAFLTLVYEYLQNDQIEAAEEGLRAMQELVPKDVLPISESLEHNIKVIEQTLNKSKSDKP